MYYPDLYQYLQQVYQYMKTQHERVKNLEARMDELEGEINALKSNGAMKIDKIEYKFDQLKVETLEGTLNIGLTPNLSEEIEQFSVNGKEKEEVSEGQEQLFQRIHKDVHHYLNHEIVNDIRQFEEKYNYKLEDPYRQFIVQDIRKQIDRRISFYLNQMNRNGSAEGPVEQAVLEKVKKDIYKAIEAFINNLPQKMEGDR
ncbi:spore germination protein GerPC [Bacillus taeanensis]|uniref:Spore gernimation protein GerPC n=1 Tax=Bacillus taeanensis TaxID=273032 RepID=A0A366XV30_9BACI|nr:spore germination protein GerPC [Bacillus taeanensis]RBW68995.1 spore gernimation protein GerPC [Bacillus taeanensis]